MPAPLHPSLYHIIHVDRLSSVIADGHMWCDEVMAARQDAGTTIGISEIKARRLASGLASRPGLRVGQCVPFYFCPRSVMLFLLHRGNHPSLTYRGGQAPILHFETGLHRLVDWAAGNGRRWAFTLSNAGAVYFEDRSDLGQLGEINWDAVNATKWSGQGIDPMIEEGKQAEFLVERSLPWELISRIGVRASNVKPQVEHILRDAVHRPVVEIVPGWYY